MNMKVKDLGSLKRQVMLDTITVKYKGKAHKVVSGWGSGKEPPYKINLWLKGEGSKVIPVTDPAAGELEILSRCCGAKIRKDILSDNSINYVCSKCNGGLYFKGNKR